MCQNFLQGICANCTLEFVWKFKAYEISSLLFIILLFIWLLLYLFNF